MAYPPPPSIHVEREPGRRRRRPLVIALVALVALIVGAGGAFAANRGAHHHHHHHGEAPARATAAPAATNHDPTCKQFLDAYTPGAENVLGEPPNDWAGHLLADLIGADGIAMQLDGLTQMGFALDLNEACLDPSVFGTSARVIGGSVYRTDKQKYTHRP